MAKFLAHIRDGAEQTVTEHLLNVSNFMRESAAPLGFSHAAGLIGLLHDMGKFKGAFLRYLQDSFSGKSNLKGPVHSVAGAKYIYDNFAAGDENAAFTAEAMAMTIMSHHTGLENFLSSDGKNSTFCRRIAEEEPDEYKEAVRNFFAEVTTQEKIAAEFAVAKNELAVFRARAQELVGAKEKFFYEGMLIKFLQSCLVDADYLDTANFMFGEDFAADWDSAEIMADFSNKLERHLGSFPEGKTEKSRRINEKRQEISYACWKKGGAEPGTYTLSVPTGSGKTLASTRFAIEQAKKYGRKRIFIVLPYISILDQNAEEIRQIFQNDEAILECHSNVINEDETGEDNVEYTRRAEQKRIMTERWDTPIIFTTMVQMLNALFTGRNRDIRRLKSLADSVIIFDEIQSLPVKCTYMFNSAMNFLTDFCRTTVLLCTATQPNFHELVIPLKTKGEIVGGLDEVFASFKRVETEMLAGSFSAEEIAENIYEDAKTRGNALGIVNMTGEARNIYQALGHYQDSDEKLKLIHMSTKMCPAHRKEKLREMRRALENNERLICISTQLIEAGVDVSFTTVYRALAGLPSIAQAAGRCNRHGEQEMGKVKIFAVAGENLQHLEDIKNGVNALKSMLSYYPAETFLDPATMTAYFEKYYFGLAEGNTLYYVFEKNNNPKKNNEEKTLYDMLSENDYGLARAEEIGDVPPLQNLQAFAEVRRAFSVIDSKSTSVAVPYKEGAELIEALNNQIYDMGEYKNLLKRLQQYTVNLFPWEIKALGGGVIDEHNGIIPVLKKEAYDEGIGVIFGEVKNDFVCI